MKKWILIGAGGLILYSILSPRVVGLSASGSTTPSVPVQQIQEAKQLTENAVMTYEAADQQYRMLKIRQDDIGGYLRDLLTRHYAWMKEDPNRQVADSPFWKQYQAAVPEANAIKSQVEQMRLIVRDLYIATR